MGFWIERLVRIQSGFLQIELDKFVPRSEIIFTNDTHDHFLTSLRAVGVPWMDISKTPRATSFTA